MSTVCWTIDWWLILWAFSGAYGLHVVLRRLS